MLGNTFRTDELIMTARTSRTDISTKWLSHESFKTSQCRPTDALAPTARKRTFAWFSKSLTFDSVFCILRAFHICMPRKRDPVVTASWTMLVLGREGWYVCSSSCAFFQRPISYNHIAVWSQHPCPMCSRSTTLIYSLQQPAQGSQLKGQT